MNDKNINLRQKVLAFLPFLRSIKRKLLWGPTIRAWEKLVAEMPEAPPRAEVRKILIVPSDPFTLTGSRGDDAMIEALIGIVRENNKNVSFSIVTSSDMADACARKRGLEPLQVWNQSFSPKKIRHIIQDYAFDGVVVVGADVMDGYYNYYVPFHMMMFVDIASRLGCQAVVLGFSFNKSPWPDLKRIFEMTNRAVHINLRDAVSLERFSAFCRRGADLVADAAFCLKPSLDSDVKRDVQRWVEKTHAEGRLAIAFNIHPMLFKDASAGQVKQLVEAAANALEAVCKSRAVNFLFLPHDFRKDVGDNVCLKPLTKELALRGLEDWFYHLEKEYSASEIKAAAGQVDGVITARMHLAIGTLGMGLPVAALTYQDKFQGLFRHFDLPNWLLISPKDILESDQLEKMMIRFIDENADLKGKVKAKLPEIMQLSRKNFEPLFIAAKTR